MPPTEQIAKLRTDHAEFYGSIRGLNTKALREKGAKLAADMRAVADKINANPAGQAEHEEAWRKVNAHYDLVRAQVDEAEDPYSLQNSGDRLAEVDRHLRDPQAGDERPASGLSRADGLRAFVNPFRGGRGGQATEPQRALALAAWARTQCGIEASDDELLACQAVGLNPAARLLTLPLLPTAQYRGLQRRFRAERHERREMLLETPLPDYGATMSGQSGPAGGYLIPPETLTRQLEINMLYFGGMRQVAETIRTSTGERMSWPTADDTGNTGVQLGENVSIGSSVDPTFGKVFWDAYKFSSKPVLVPFELLQDSAFDLVTVLGQLLGIRLGRITNTKFTTGTGNNTCKGIVPAATTFNAISSTALFPDDLFKLMHGVDPAYRDMPGSGFMFHDQILLTLRLLKDGTGRPLWFSGLADGIPDRLLAKGFTVNQDMDSTFASGKKTVLYGHLPAYKIRTVGQVRLYHLVERYRDTDQDAFIALTREDGNLLTAGTAVVKVLTHP